MEAEYPRICYVPLDERPCNASFPGMHLGHAVELVSPPTGLLGNRKSPGDVDALAAWLEEELPSCDACVASVEQLVYGGLVPSRLHGETPETLKTRIARLRRVFRKNPQVNINLFALIMRTPSYSSSDEEPDYYERYGEAIYKRSVLRDKRNLGCDIDSKALEALEQTIPDSVIADYEHRREVNRSILEQVLELYAEGSIHYVAIPMDDSSRYGYTAADRRYVRRRIVELGLDDQVPVYPGADETGMTLVGRAASRHAGRTPSIFPLYHHEEAKHHFPKYEGLELDATVAEHIRTAGCTTADSMDACDIVLAIHSGPRIEEEASEQPGYISCDTHTTDSTGDNFAAAIARLVGDGTPVAVADIAYANGGDIELVRKLDRHDGLAALAAYGGWNTPGNTLGCVIATAVAQFLRGEESSRTYGILYRLFDDVCYQAHVRSNLAGHTEPPTSPERVAGMINASWDRLGLQSFRELSPEISAAELPWNRLFEVNLQLSVKEIAAGASL